MISSKDRSDVSIQFSKVYQIQSIEKHLNDS